MDLEEISPSLYKMWKKDMEYVRRNSMLGPIKWVDSWAKVVQAVDWADWRSVST